MPKTGGHAPRSAGADEQSPARIQIEYRRPGTRDDYDLEHALAALWGAAKIGAAVAVPLGIWSIAVLKYFAAFEMQPLSGSLEASYYSLWGTEVQGWLGTALFALIGLATVVRVWRGQRPAFWLVRLPIYLGSWLALIFWLALMSYEYFP
jgi:hypothetical protein